MLNGLNGRVVNGAVVNGRHRALFADEGDLSDGGASRPDPDRAPPFVVRVVRGLLRPRSIKAKLSRILLVSLVLVLAALAIMVTGRLRDYRSATVTTRVVTVALSVQDLVHNLQKERGLTNGLLGGGAAFQAPLAAVRPQTDSTLAALRKLVDDPAEAGAGTAQVRSALGDLRNLGSVRQDVDARRAVAGATFTYYTDAVAALNGLQLGLDQASDPALRQGLQALYALGDAKESTGQERGLLNGVFSGAPFPIDQYVHLTEIRADKQNALTRYDHSATPAERQALDVVLHTPSAIGAATFESIATAGVSGVLPQHVDAQAWWDRMTTVIDDMRTVQRSVGADITNRAHHLRDIALRELVAFLVAAAVAVGIQVALVVGALRSIIGPLGALAGDADDVSSRRLPEAVRAWENAESDDVVVPEPVPLAVPWHSGTEIRRVARALSRLQETALSLAAEQAMVRRNTTVSLANLGRRNQNLVRRQLSLISEFEREELDPAALANMFELDHLATRMRRNAESLLVLVGESGPKPWSPPMSIVDVMRASLSEVEDYRRVSLRRIDDVLIAGSAVTEVAHMLAELVENGLAFSPPDVEVEVFGRRMGNRYTIAVIDHGAGMQPDALVKANARLHDEENFLVAPTRFLGHYVVGRLARGLGVEVNLAPAPITGITARLVLPSELLADTGARPGERPDGAATSASTGWTDPSESRPGAQAEQTDAGSSRRPMRTLSGMVDTFPVQLTTGRTVVRNPTANGSGPPGPVPTSPERVRVDVRGERERTRNGLVKRQARSARPRPGVAGVAAAQAWQPSPDAAARARTPDEIGAMLSAYRAGHHRAGQHRGEQDGPVRGPQRPVPPPGRGPAGTGGQVDLLAARPTYPVPRQFGSGAEGAGGQADGPVPGSPVPDPDRPAPTPSGSGSAERTPGQDADERTDQQVGSSGTEAATLGGQS